MWCLLRGRGPFPQTSEKPGSRAPLTATAGLPHSDRHAAPGAFFLPSLREQAASCSGAAWEPGPHTTTREGLRPYGSVPSASPGPAYENSLLVRLKSVYCVCVLHGGL